MSTVVRSMILLLALAGMVTAPRTVRAQQRDHTDVPREQWQRVADILSALGVAPGGSFADLGAGQGYFTTRLAKAVGSGGKIYAVDVNPVSLRELRNTIGAEFPNVEAVRGEEDDPRLPEAALDGILVVNAYHEFAEYAAMLRQMHRALKPGGRLVLVEPIPRGADTTRAAQTRRHAIGIDVVDADLKEAGFEIVSRDAAFVSRPGHITEAASSADAAVATDWLLVARRPAATHQR